ncbi:hypothetical protein E2C01_055884 [Portunus trituberculatus]|uniref:Uncharacterized protein n=1 Tax=Portunus trituberculatus TaxID=210409 RepID=A0A5B7GXB7_PORTR|nr:hypothetical protein [Portunus trituberculatus]
MPPSPSHSLPRRYHRWPINKNLGRYPVLRRERTGRAVLGGERRATLRQVSRATRTSALSSRLYRRPLPAPCSPCSTTPHLLPTTMPRTSLTHNTARRHYNTSQVLAHSDSRAEHRGLN